MFTITFIIHPLFNPLNVSMFIMHLFFDSGGFPVWGGGANPVAEGLTDVRHGCFSAKRVQK